MQIVINNDPRDVAVGSNLYEIIKSLKLESTAGIAIAVNDIVIPRSRWDKELLQPNDSVLIITATQGG